MKLSTLLFSTLAIAATPAFALKPGDTIAADALGKAEAIKGELVTKWEPGKLYIVECWATWCGPCIAAIPHVDELYDKYHEKGLRVIGMNVFEQEKEKAVEFVKSKGDGMSYPVAFAADGSDFDKEWLKPAGVRGIPHAFVVKDGKYLFSSHPMKLDAALIEDLLAGGEKADAAIANLSQKEKDNDKVRHLLMKFSNAKEGNNAEGMTEAIKEAESLPALKEFIPLMKLDLNVAQGKWDDALKQLDALDGQRSVGVLASLIRQFITVPDSKEPESFKREILKRTQKVTSAEGAPAVLLIYQAQFQWALGDKKDAAATARLLAQNPKDLPKEPLERFASSLEAGKAVSTDELFGWMREAIKEKAAPK